MDDENADSRATRGPFAIGVDVGGSGIKVAPVDTATGILVGYRARVKTPQPSRPEEVIERIVKLVERAGAEVDEVAAVGVGVPSVVLDGVTKTAANIDPEWVDYPVQQALREALRRPVVIVNDADAAGVAELRFGAGAGVAGTVVVLTLGTGTGSGVFVDGKLVPNTELGHMEIRGRAAERRSAASARVRRSLSWKAWAIDLDEHLEAIDRILWPSLFILGGGVSKSAERFVPLLKVRPPVVPATLKNDAGIVGAAIFAAEHERAAGG